MIPYLSYSGISLYETDPVKWARKYIFKNLPPENFHPARAIGSAGHHLIQLHLSAAAQQTQTWKTPENPQLGEPILDMFIRSGAAKFFAEKSSYIFEKELLTPLKSEKYGSYTTFKGFADMVDINNHEVYDIKTSGWANPLTLNPHPKGWTYHWNSLGMRIVGTYPQQIPSEFRDQTFLYKTLNNHINDQLGICPQNKVSIIYITPLGVSWYQNTHTSNIVETGHDLWNKIQTNTYLSEEQIEIMKNPIWR